MRIGLTLLICSILLVVVSCFGPNGIGTRCPNTEMKRVPSPDGKLVIVIYNHRCLRLSSGSSTSAEVEYAVRYTWQGDPTICHLVTLPSLDTTYRQLDAGTYHQLDAVWKDAKHIEVSSTDELGPDIPLSKNETCDDIAVNYKFKFKPRPVQEAPDKKTLEAITEAISRSQDCIDIWAGAGHSKYFWKLVQENQHREALELLCSNLEDAKCPISKSTFGLISQAATTMGIDKRDCVDNLPPLVQNDPAK